MTASPYHRSLVLTAWVAGAFCLLLCGVMIFEHFAAATNDPWKSPQLLTLKEKLAVEPKNGDLPKEIRLLDQSFREKFRRRLALDKTGGWLLLGGMFVLVLAAGKAAALTKATPFPGPKTDAAEQSIKLALRARAGLVVVAVLVAGALVIVTLDNTSVLPTNDAGWQKLTGKESVEAAPVEAPPALAEFQTNWPRFRGWDGSGVSTQTNSGTNLLWQSAIPLPGHSSPVVWGDRVFISGGTEAKREVYCYHATDGKLLWQRAVENVPGSPPKTQGVPEDTTYAAPTVATDGRRVYAFFANGDLAALNFDGSIAWTKYLGPLKNSYGFATSLAIWGTNLIFQLDQGESAGEGSKLISFQASTGHVVWERSRPVPASWATPLVGTASGKTQIITLANPWVIAYTAADGQELWRAQLLEGEVVPSPVLAGDLVVLFNPSSKMLALRTDGSGDVTQTGVAWTHDENVPDITSPVSTGPLVFTVTSIGTVTCCQSSDGKKVWDKNLDTETQASPGIAGDRLFVLGTGGTLVQLAAGREFHEIGRCQIRDKFFASPAFVGGQIFLRGMTNLYCLGPAAGPKQP
jgi:outer membrane protein assembly factor BamB